MNGTYNIRVPEHINKCETCQKIIKTGGYIFSSKDFEDISAKESNIIFSFKNLLNEGVTYRNRGGPKLHAIYYYPHRCTFVKMMEVQMFYDNSWIRKELFDAWMSMNSGDYQLGMSGKINWLWDDRYLHLGRDSILKASLKELLTDSYFDKESLIKIDKCSYHQTSYHCKIKKKGTTPSRKQLIILNKLFPFSSVADKKKTNVDLASFTMRAIQYGLLDRVNKAFEIIPVGTHNVLAVAMMIQICGNKYSDTMFDLIKRDHACCLDPTHYSKYMKAVTTALRRTSIWYDGTTFTVEQVASLSYWEMCIGRSHMISDWEVEMDNRLNNVINLRMPLCEDRSVESNSEYIDNLNISLDEIMSQLIPTRINFETWHNFCENRQSWLSSGSSGGQFLIIDEDKVRINKRTYFENLPIDEQLGWLDSEPQLRATASEKFEQSKARAIYGTMPMDYAIMSFAISKLEAKLFNIEGVEGGLTGADEVRSIMRRCVMFREDPELEGLMIDYADFNIQHTLEAQSAIFAAIEKRLKSLGVTGDIIKAVIWCKEACLNQWVRFPGETEFKRVVQGLFSGNRGTNFINTILNVAYFKTAARWLKDNLNLVPKRLFNIHQGDDVCIVFKNRLWGMALYMAMKNSGFVFQDSKQLQDVARCEFLRVITSKDGSMGYLARAIGTFIIRPLQGEDEISPDAKTTALNSQIMLLFRRGLNVETCMALWDASVRHAATSTLPSGDSVTIPMNIVNRNYLDGGLDCGYPLTMADRAQVVAPVPTIVMESPSLFEEVQRHTSSAWVKVISSKYKGNIDAEALEEMLHKINVSDSIMPKDKIKCLSNLHRQIKKWLRTVNNCEPVNRSREVWDKWLISSKSIRIDPRIKKVVDRQIMLMKTKVDTNVLKTKMEIILSAMSASPFKDIATAQRALGLGLVEATRVALRCTKNTSSGIEALTIVDDIERKTSKHVLARILSGVRGISAAFHCILHPIILSWINRVALDIAINEAMATRVTDLHEWDNLLLKWQEMGVQYVLQKDIFKMISRY